MRVHNCRFRGPILRFCRGIAAFIARGAEDKHEGGLYVKDRVRQSELKGRKVGNDGEVRDEQ